MPFLISLLIFLSVLGIVLFIICILISLEENDTGLFLAVLIVLVWAAFMLVCAAHNTRWEDRKRDFKERYELARLIQLTDDKAKYVKQNEDICTAKVMYKPSDPHGELYIVRGSEKCKKTPKLDLKPEG
jgi:hypothetical protein